VVALKYAVSAGLVTLSLASPLDTDNPLARGVDPALAILTF